MSIDLSKLRASFSGCGVKSFYLCKGKELFGVVRLEPAAVFEGNYKKLRDYLVDAFNQKNASSMVKHNRKAKK